MDLHEAIGERRSVGIFKPDSIPRGVIIDIRDSARWAPTGRSTQSIEIFAIEKTKVGRLLCKRKIPEL